MDELRLVWTTVPDEPTALVIARTLVEERLCACANLWPGMKSVYRWNDALEEGQEVVLVLKTTAARLPELLDRLRQLHPWEVPCGLPWKVEDGLPGYAAWLRDQVR